MGYVSVTATAIFLFELLLALSRTSRRALFWYRFMGLLEGLLGMFVGLREASVPWLLLGLLWALAKGLVIPSVLVRAAHRDYGLQAAGTPRQIFLAILLFVAWASFLGTVGMVLATTLTPLWLATERREATIQALHLLAAEVGLGLLSIANGVVALGEWWAVIEAVGTACLLLFLLQRLRRLPQLTDGFQEG